jgi:hypothetical protein
MIDEPRVVSPDRRVDDLFIVDDEEEGVMALHLLVVVPPVGFVIVDVLAGVLDDALSAANLPRRKSAEPLDRRFAQLERLLLHCRHVTRPMDDVRLEPCVTYALSCGAG